MVDGVIGGVDEVGVVAVEHDFKLVAELLFALDVESVFRPVDLNGHAQSLQLLHIVVGERFWLEETFAVIDRIGVESKPHVSRATCCTQWAQQLVASIEKFAFLGNLC